MPLSIPRAAPALATACCALVLATPSPAQRPAPGASAPPADFDAYVARVMRVVSVPGVAVAIVADGKVVLTKGYGVRKLGESAPVGPRTRFGIASNT